jgi:hypothetical protein
MSGRSRTILGCASLIVVVCSGGEVAGGSGDCELLRDGDRRHFCRALMNRKALYCESIRDSDVRHTCRAVVTGKQIYCESVKDSAARAECRTRVQQ